MPHHVCMTAQLKCSMGKAPSKLMVPVPHMALTDNKMAANIMDHVPMMNIMPFGLCDSTANPSVITATAAAQGVHTPMPCIPVTPAPWVTGSPTVMLDNQPALNKSSTLACMWAGTITIEDEGQATHDIP